MLEKSFPGATFSITTDELSARFGDWTARIVDSRESWVAEEAREMMERAPESARPALAAANHRIEIYDSGDADADDNHYNDGLALFDYFIGISGAVGHDPVSGEFFVAARKP